MTIIIGLGNPEDKYQSTRHNIGWMVIDSLAQHFQPNAPFKTNPKLSSLILKSDQLILAKPTTYMNRSGEAASKIIAYYSDQIATRNSKIDNLYIVHDDLDIALGDFKIQFGKGPKVHNGIASIEHALDTDGFWRIRVGIDNRAGDRSIPGKAYVLQPFNHDEQQIIKTVISNIIKSLGSRI